MNGIIGNLEEILDKQIPGFHQQLITPTAAHLTYVGRSFCTLTGYEREELLEAGGYEKIVYPADQEIYAGFLRTLNETGRSGCNKYRLVRKNGEVIYVLHSLEVERQPDGSLRANGTLQDVTTLCKEMLEMQSLQFLNDTVPCGFIKYTCEKQPRITYINDRMLKMLRFPDRQEDPDSYMNILGSNVFRLFAPLDRPKLADFLEKVAESTKPMIGEISVLRGDGSKGRIYGWITKVRNPDGTEEFQSVCMDVTKDYHARKISERDRYLKALSDIYDKIFECNFAEQTVTYVHGHQKSSYGKIKGIPMMIDGVLEQWVANTIYEEDVEAAQAFFRQARATNARTEDGKPLSYRFRAVALNGELKKYIGTFLTVSSSISLFCIRYDIDEQESDHLRDENQNLRDNMRSLVTQFSNGMVAFEYEDGYIKPLYGNQIAYQFFGYTEQEWMQFYNKPNPAREFLSRTNLPFEAFEKILSDGEAEFTYYGTRLKKFQRLKAVCSRKNPDGTGPIYIMLYDIHDDEPRALQSTPHPEAEALTVSVKPSIRTFGYFDVFIGDKPVVFRSKKSKELLALLVDRRGGFVTTEQAIGFLWEDEEVNSVTLARCRKIALRLKNTLEEYGIGDIYESVDGRRRIIMDRVQCDLYDYLSGGEEHAQLFKGSYLTDYSWGENTLGELMGEHLGQY